MRTFVFFVTFFAVILLTGCKAKDQPETRNTQPNVLFIAMDDMNDWTQLFDEKHPIKTPNMIRLAKNGVFFRQAYANAPSCNPSRFSLLSGKIPSNTGVYGNSSDWKSAHEHLELLPEYFKNQGYKTYGSGKIFHHHAARYTKYEVFEESLAFPLSRPDAPMPADNLNGITHWYNKDLQQAKKVSPNFDWGVWPPDPGEHVDHRTVNWAIGKLKNHTGKPFFMAVGIFRPHMPFFAPSEFFDQYPVKSSALPEINPNDFDDLEDESVRFIKRHARFMNTFEGEKQRDPSIFKKAVSAYQVAATYADYQLGRMLDALEQSPYAENTIVVLWSDHGYHLGEKDHWEKFVLYEKACHVPFIWAGPGITNNKVSNATVSLVDMYPTLVELCGLPSKEGLDGRSITSLLTDPSMRWTFPVVTTYGHNNHAIRSDQYRYIRLQGGTKELYNTAEDPNEWENLAKDPGHQKWIDSLDTWIPAQNVEPVPNWKGK